MTKSRRLCMISDVITNIFELLDIFESPLCLSSLDDESLCKLNYCILSSKNELKKCMEVKENEN